MKELELERQLMNESFRLRNIDTDKISFEKSRDIHKQQDEVFHKFKLLSGILKEREKNERIYKKTNF